MQLEKLGTIKKRKVTIPKKTIEILREIQEFAKETKGLDLDPSDILGSAVNSSISKASIPEKEEPEEVSFSLPASLWDSIDSATKRAGATKADLIEKLIDIQSRNREFLKWKKSKKK